MVSINIELITRRIVTPAAGVMLFLNDSIGTKNCSVRPLLK